MIEHLSYSQYSTYQRCARSWYLGKIAKAEEKPTWFLVIGSAVHTAIEAHLKGEPFDLTEIFYGLVSKQMKVEPDLSLWLHGGSSSDPIVKDRALARAQECFDKALTFLDDIDVWEIEYDASGTLPGLDIPIKAYIDIIGEHKKHGPVIVDWKTGAQKPKDNFQLETYKALLDQLVFANDDEVYKFNKGLWAMLAPQASKARPIDLSHVSPAEVGAKYQAVYEKMQRKLYQTNAGFDCKFCFQSPNCLLVAGPTKRARYFDHADRDGMPY